MRIYRSNVAEEDGTPIPYDLAQDPSLSFAARGLLIELLSRPDGYETNVDAMSLEARESRPGKAEGRRATRGLIAELEAAGYIVRRREHVGGRFATTLEVHDAPQGAPTEKKKPAPGRLVHTGNVVYLIGTPGHPVAKIGTTTKLSSRLKGIQTSSPTPVDVLWFAAGDTGLEIALHDRFADLRLHGEWFDFGDADPVEAVSSAAAELTV